MREGMTRERKRGEGNRDKKEMEKGTKSVG